MKLKSYLSPLNSSPILSLVHYFAALLGHKQNITRNLLTMGMGIMQRNRCLSRYWVEHLESCRKVQRTWLGAEQTKNTKYDKTIGVLGAGYLLDLDLELLANHYSKIILIDGNPLVRPTWSKQSRCFKSQSHLEGYILEISGLLSTWEAKLRNLIAPLPSNEKGWKEALEVLSQCRFDQHFIPLKGHNTLNQLLAKEKLDTVISLNILSQIPIVWQDCVEGILQRHFPLVLTKYQQEAWLTAIMPSAKRLILASLRDISALAPEKIVLVTDIEYAHYNWPRRFSRRNCDEIPFLWQQESKTTSCGWVLNPKYESISGNTDSLQCEVSNALYGINLEEDANLLRLLPNYKVISRTDWLWHIQPYGLESNQSHGTINRVIAVLLHRLR